MKYIALIALIVALATVVLGQSSSVATGDFVYITSPVGTTVFTAGKAGSVTWKYTSGAGAPTTVQLDLLNNGVLVSSIATGVKASGGKYSWAVPATEASSYYYSIRISDPTTNYQSYSHAFTIKGVGALSSISVPASSTSAYTYVAPSASLSATAVIPSNTASVSAPANASSSAPAISATAAAKSSASKVGSNALAALSVFVIAIVILA